VTENRKKILFRRRKILVQLELEIKAQK
jgi:hypothetical protein